MQYNCCDSYPGQASHSFFSMTGYLTLRGSIFRHSCICVEHEQAPWNGCLGIISGTSRCQPGTLIHVPFHRQERHQVTGWGQPQAQVRYGISGENFPPFGCLTTGNVPRADTLRCVSTDCLNRIWCVNLKDIVPGVGRPGHIAAGTCPNTRSYSHPHFSGTTHLG